MSKSKNAFSLKFSIALLVLITSFSFIHTKQAFAASAYVNGCNTETIANSASCTIPNATAGHVVAAYIAWYHGSALNSVSICGVPATLYNNPTNQGTNTSAAWAVAVVGSTGNCAVTASLSGSQFTDIVAHEISGVSTSNPVDQSAITPVGYESGTNACASASVTTTSNGEYVMGVCNDDGNAAAFTAGTGFTLRQSQTASGFDIVSEDEIQTTAGSFQIAESNTNPANAQAGIMTFNPSTGGGSNPPTDTTAPSVPTSLAASASSQSTINLTWTASTDNIGVSGYNIYRGGVKVGTSGTNTYSDTGLTASTQYTYTVSAYDAAGNTSAQTSGVSATTQATPVQDTTPPSTPTGVSATAISSSQISLSWLASTDNVGVTGYKIFRGGVQVGTSATNNYSDSGLSASTQYTYTVSAYDAAGNTSTQSSGASATTQAQVVSTGGDPLAAGIIDPSRSVNWTTAGVIGGIPNRTTQCGATIPAYSGTASTINTAIANCPAGDYVQLGAGTFNLSTGITWDASNYVNNVTLRGMGANQTMLVFSGYDDCNGLSAVICIAGGNSSANGEANVCNWTAGYAQGSTNITLSNCGATTPSVGSISNLHIGSLVALDQVDQVNDPGTVWNCIMNDGVHPRCVTEGQGGDTRTDGPSVNGIPNRTQMQVVQVTNCTNVNGVCTNGNNITISPGLYMSNWTSTQAPQAWFANTDITGDGVENLSIDGTNSGSIYNITLMNASQSWVKGVRSIFANRSHVTLTGVTHSTVEDSYFYQNNSHLSVSYGIQYSIASDNLVQNNIVQQVTDSSPSNVGAAEGNVTAYNYAIDTQFTASGWFQSSYYLHAGGDAMNMWEGNVGTGFIADNIHGTHNLETLFRNYFPGWQSSCDGSACNQQTVPINLMSGSRYFNLVGNVLGQPGYHTQYQCMDTSGNSTCTSPITSIYGVGWTSYGPGNVDSLINGWCINYPTCTVTGDYDPQSVTTLLRWGNWDAVNNATQWNPSEIPTTIGPYANAVPSNQSLPPSLYLTAKPAFWGSNPWPAIGPDVTGGTVTAGSGAASSLGGHVYMNPAMSCAFNIMGMPSDGSGNALTFNASTCYPGDYSGSTGNGGTGGGTPPPTPVPGDLNSDHIVNSLDFSLLNSKWGQNYPAYDLYPDGIINSLDYAIMSANWGKTW